MLAPHPDDDAIGCGGTLARAAASGSHVRVIYMTDGAASHPGSKRYPPHVLRDVRAAEARAGLRALGIAQEPIFLDVPDGTVARLSGSERERVVLLLAAALATGDCDLVLGPWLREPHPDHAASAALLLAALERCPRPPELWTYAVWLDEFGTAADHPPPNLPCVEIALDARETARKRAAILAHRSQTTGLVDDSPHGFRISADQLERWLRPAERFWLVPAGNTKIR